MLIPLNLVNGVCVCLKLCWDWTALVGLFIFLLVALLQVALLLLLALCSAILINGEVSDGQCDDQPTLDPRPHSVSITEFGAVGDGKTLNTLAFQNAIFYLKSFADKGGAQLYVPSGKWLTGSFNLTSHLTLFLEKGAVILGSQVLSFFFFLHHHELLCSKMLLLLQNKLELFGWPFIFIHFSLPA